MALTLATRLTFAGVLLMGVVACTPSVSDTPPTASSTPSVSPSAPQESQSGKGSGGAQGTRELVHQAFLAARDIAKSRKGTVGVALHDLATGEKWGNRDASRRVRSASVVKLEAAAWYLEHEEGVRKYQLGPLIRMSDDQTMYDLYDPVKRDVFSLIKRHDTKARFSTWWGWTEITAQGRVQFLSELVTGNLLGPKDTRYLLSLMRDVHPSQRWGLAEAFERHGHDALIKNGWFAWDTGLTSINCMAVLDGPVRERQLVVAVTNSYPNELGLEYGQHTCRLIGKALYRNTQATWSRAD